MSRCLAKEGYTVLRLDTESTQDEKGAPAPNRPPGNLLVCKDMAEFLDRLVSPRCVWILEDSDERLERWIRDLIPALDDGDLIVDLSDSYFLDTERRACAIQSRGILFLGVSMTGLSTTLMERPGLMAGGDPRAFTAIKPLFLSLAGRAQGGEACAGFIGPRGAGHFSGMFCSGLQRCEHTLFLEACRLLFEIDAAGFSQALDRWKDRDPGFLILTAARAVKGEDRTTRILRDVRSRHDGFESDPRMQQQARSLNMSLSLLSDLSIVPDDRMEAGRNGGSPEFIDDLWTVLQASRRAMWVQCMDFFDAASREYNYFLNTGALLNIWLERTWLRSSLLREIAGLYASRPMPEGLLKTLNRSAVLPDAGEAWKRLSHVAGEAGLNCPGMAASMAVLES